jgi:RimJ/RimL family protein N-acetyltransferase
MWAIGRDPASLRHATLSDAPKLAEIHVAAWRAAYADHMPSEFLASMRVEERTAMWQTALSEPSSRTVTVSVNHADEPVAFCVYGPSRDQDAKDTDIGELIAINVHPSAWRQGHGQDLCRCVLDHAESQRWSAVTLWVLRGNGRARAFYETLGFAPDGAEKQETHRLGLMLDVVRYTMRIENANN